MPAPDDATDDDRQFALLDAYTRALQGAQPDERARLLAEHPELADLARCLDELDRLAPPLEPTLVWEGKEPLAEPSGSATRFDRFELLAEVGRGGMGVVFKARQAELDRVVAVKMILAGQLATPEQVRRFRDEARVAARLRHPNIVQIYEAGEVHGQAFFAMEYVEGESLAAAVRRGPMTPDTAAACVAAVARGVAYLHDQGVVHRDIKPSNILLDRTGRPVLTDFGLVKVLGTNDGATGSGGVLGTPCYMAPEQATGRRDVGPAADVYSLGAVLYEQLTGQPPFRGATAVDTLLLVLETEPATPAQLRPDVPRDLELICLKCLEKDPARRYPSAAALADDLGAYLRREPVEARAGGVWHAARRWARREPALAIHLALLAVCALIFAARDALGGVTDRPAHWRVLGLLGVWSLFSFGCQALLRRQRWPQFVIAIWLIADAVFLSACLVLASAAPGALAVCYAAFIAASSLWAQPRLVRATTILAVVCYAAVVALATGRASLVELHHHLIAALMLTTLGLIVAHQVQRVHVVGGRTTDGRLE